MLKAFIDKLPADCIEVVYQVVRSLGELRPSSVAGLAEKDRPTFVKETYRSMSEPPIEREPEIPFSGHAFRLSLAGQKRFPHEFLEPEPPNQALGKAFETRRRLFKQS